MTDHQRRPVFGRPPVDGTDEELEEWAREFVDRLVAHDEAIDDHSPVDEVQVLALSWMSTTGTQTTDPRT
jgi:hypothetical protein